jgi:hypothetical protein
MAEDGPSFSGELRVALRMAERSYLPAIGRLLAVDAIVFEFPSPPAISPNHAQPALPRCLVWRRKSSRHIEADCSRLN